MAPLADIMRLYSDTERNQSNIREVQVSFSDSNILGFNILIYNFRVKIEICPLRRWSQSSYVWVRPLNGEARFLQRFILHDAEQYLFFWPHQYAAQYYWLISCGFTIKKTSIILICTEICVGRFLVSLITIFLFSINSI